MVLSVTTVETHNKCFFHSAPSLPTCPRVLGCHARLFVTPRTVAHRAPLSIKFCRQEYWSGLPFSAPGDLPDPGIELVSLFSWVGRRILYHQATWGASRPPHPAPSLEGSVVTGPCGKVRLPAFSPWKPWPWLYFSFLLWVNSPSSPNRSRLYDSISRHPSSEGSLGFHYPLEDVAASAEHSLPESTCLYV